MCADIITGQTKYLEQHIVKRRRPAFFSVQQTLVAGVDTPPLCDLLPRTRVIWQQKGDFLCTGQWRGRTHLCQAR